MTSLDAYTASVDMWKEDTDALHASVETCNMDAEAKAVAGPRARVVEQTNARLEATFCWKVSAHAMRVLYSIIPISTECIKLGWDPTLTRVV